jgi:glutaredoxin
MKKASTKTATTDFFASSLLLALLVAGSCLVATRVQAQQIYRIVGPDGRITFSDKPPVEASAKVSTGSGNSSAGSVSAGLPFELRQVAAKYPVMLYTGDNCNPCGAARSLLTGRGIPFTEKTVTTNDDVQALQRLSGDTSLPFATIGGQQLKGFSDNEWVQYLDAAGYPKASTLPPSYRRPEPTPMVAVSPAPTPAATATTEGRTVVRPATPAAATTPPPNNPAGIRF